MRTAVSRKVSFSGTPIIVVPVIYLLLQLFAVSHAPASLSLDRRSDGWEYVQLSEGLRHGCGFARYVNGVCGSPEILRTPGYPLFLAMFSNWQWALVGQAFLCGGVCLASGMWVGSRWSREAGTAAQLLIAANVPSYVLNAMVLSETLFQTVLLAAVIATLGGAMQSRPKASAMRAIVSGALIGCLALIRPVAICLIPAGIVPFIFRRNISRRRKLALMCLSVAVPAGVVALWSIRNYRQGGLMGLSTVSSLELYLYRAGNVVAMKTGQPLWQVQKQLIDNVGAAHLMLYGNEVSATLASEMSRRAWHILLGHPFESAAVTAQAFVWLLIAPSRSLLARLLRTSGGGLAEAGLAQGRITPDSLLTITGEVLRSRLLTLFIIFQLLVTLTIWIGAARALLRLGETEGDMREWIVYPLTLTFLLLLAPSGPEAAVRFRSVTIPLLAITASMGYFRPDAAARAEAAISASGTMQNEAASV